MNGVGLVAQLCTSSTNAQTAMDEWDFNRCDSSMLLPRSWLTDAHKVLQRMDQTRTHTIDDEFQWKWWKKCEKVGRKLREFWMKSLLDLRNEMWLCNFCYD